MSEITLLIPCHNAALFLPRLHESMRGLHVPFTRVLCYDDGSTDDTVLIARSLGLEILTGQPNRGVAHARNQLAAAVRSEWIHFHDADDLLAPAFLTRLAPWCDERHDVVSCDADWIDETTRDLIIAWRYNPAALASAPHPHLLEHPMSLNNSIIRRSAWVKIGGCDESLRMWEDADVHIRLAREGARFHHVPEVLTSALRRGGSFSHNYRASWTSRVTALEKYATAQLTPVLAAIIAAQAEKAAAELALLDARPAAERAIALCRRLGVRPPSTNNPILRLLKTFLPAYPLVRCQARRRQRPVA